MRAGILLLCVACVAGCTVPERDAALSQGEQLGRQAAHRVSVLAADAWQKASAEASKLDRDSAASALRSAKASLEQAERRLQPGRRMDEARAEIDRLRSALQIQKLSRELDERLADARKLEENTGKSVEEIRAQLAAADRSYRDIQSKYDQAERAYDAATTRVGEIRKAIVDKIDDVTRTAS